MESSFAASASGLGAAPPPHVAIAPLRRCHLARVALAATVTAAVADWLFYGRPVGWSVAVFAAFLLVVVLTTGAGRALRSGRGWVVALLTCGAVVALVEEPTFFATLFGALGLGTLALATRVGWGGGAGAWAGRWARFVLSAPVRALLDQRVAAAWAARHPVAARRVARWGVAGAWALPLAMGLAFTALFAQANPVIDRWAAHAVAWARGVLPNPGDVLAPPRVALWTLAFLGAWRLLRARVGRRKTPPPPPAGVVTLMPLNPVSRLHPSVVARCLLVSNAVFSVQNGMDAAYLWGGAALPDGMTYAHYAHRGAYPLVATALLAAAFVLLTFRSESATERSRACRGLVYLWVAQNVVLTLSAAWRLKLYVAAYSLTEMRVAAGVWMLLVAAGLVWVVLRIALRRGNAWLLHANLLTAGAVLYACAFVNVPGLIAGYNERHCAEAGGGGPPIDLAYLRQLGPAALPALADVTDKLHDPQDRRAARWYAAELWDELQDDLSDWRGWTLRRARTDRACPARPDASAGPPDGSDQPGYRRRGPRGAAPAGY